MVIKTHHTLLRITEANDARLILGMMLMAVAATTVITRLLARRHLTFPQRIQAFTGAVALVGTTIGQHLVDDGVVAIEAFSLIVRTLLPVQPQPVHPFDDGVDRLLSRALQIGIFDAQDKFTLMVTGKQPGVECGTSAADVQETGRTGSKTGFDFHA